MDWSLNRCGRAGHVTYAPDEPHLLEQMHARTASADLWQCLRCGTFVPGAPDGTGPAAQAPLVRRGKQIRGDLILKLFAVERAFRVLLFGAVAIGVWKFASSKDTLTEAINKEFPIVRSLFRQLGFTINNSLLDRLHSLLHISTSNLHLIALGIVGLALVSGIEAFALWQAKRWGEYFATIVTSLGLPWEVYELSKAVTATKAVLFVLNLLLVFYLVYSRRLFGARGGKEAYENRLSHESVIDAAEAAAAAARPATPATTAPAAEPATAPHSPPVGPAAASATVPMGTKKPFGTSSSTGSTAAPASESPAPASAGPEPPGTA